MKIFDCFMYSDEEIVLDTRLNCLNPYVDYFVIIESCFTHSGDRRELNFDIKKYKKFKDKIIYKVYDQIPNKIEKVFENDDESKKSIKYIMNALYRENSQRNFISEGIKEANNEDLILVSDVDEIPNLSNIDLKTVSQKIILFKQNMFCYKFNLKLPNLKWTGTKACQKKYLISPQWLRNVKDRKFPFYRIDTFFSQNKYTSVKIIEDGGWHFTNIKTAEEIQKKLKSYLHHGEFDEKPLSINEIQNIINNKRTIYNLGVDKRRNKFGSGDKLEKFEFEKLPEYIQKNYKIYKNWLD